MWNKYLQSRVNVASQHKRDSNFEEADKIYNELFQEYPQNSILYKSRAKNYAAWGYFDKALSHFEKAYQIASNGFDKNEEFQSSYHYIMMKQFKTQNYDQNANATFDYGVSTSFYMYLKTISGNIFNFVMPDYKI